MALGERPYGRGTDEFGLVVRLRLELRLMLMVGFLSPFEKSGFYWVVL